MKTPVENLLKASGVDLSNGGDFEELGQIQEHLSDKNSFICLIKARYIMFTGNSFSDKKLYFLYNADTRHYNVTTNIKAVMVERYMCNACDTLYDNTQM